jgi:hypothetical protein
VLPSVPGQFVETIKGEPIELTSTNVLSFAVLCAEFDFTELSARVASFPESVFCDEESRRWILVLEEWYCEQE